MNTKEHSMSDMSPVVIARVHAAVLICSSLIGIVGYYRQHGVFQVTACIPATAGLVLILLTTLDFTSERTRAWLLFGVAFVFGLIVTRLALRFVFQDFQPLRKRLYFPAMTLSSIVSCAVLLRHLARRG
jgi:uncharacterized membrane protein YfcA